MAAHSTQSGRHHLESRHFHFGNKLLYCSTSSAAPPISSVLRFLQAFLLSVLTICSNHVCSLDRVLASEQSSSDHASRNGTQQQQEHHNDKHDNTVPPPAPGQEAPPVTACPIWLSKISFASWKLIPLYYAAGDVYHERIYGLPRPLAPVLKEGEIDADGPSEGAGDFPLDAVYADPPVEVDPWQHNTNPRDFRKRMFVAEQLQNAAESTHFASAVFTMEKVGVHAFCERGLHDGEGNMINVVLLSGMQETLEPNPPSPKPYRKFKIVSVRIVDRPPFGL